MGNMIKVGMADLKVCKCPDALTTLGLGSCVGFEHIAMQAYNGKDTATLSNKFTNVLRLEIIQMLQNLQIQELMN